MSKRVSFLDFLTKRKELYPALETVFGEHAVDDYSSIQESTFDDDSKSWFNQKSIAL